MNNVAKKPINKAFLNVNAFFDNNPTKMGRGNNKIKFPTIKSSVDRQIIKGADNVWISERNGIKLMLATSHHVNNSRCSISVIKYARFAALNQRSKGVNTNRKTDNR